MNCSADNVALSEDSREISCHLGGYIAKNWKSDMEAAVTNF